MTQHGQKVQRVAEPLYEDNLPKDSYITLEEVINLIARHSVEIAEEDAKQIEEYVVALLKDERAAHVMHLLPPTGMLERIYRRWAAAGQLHWELMEYGDRSPAWRNWMATGQPVRLDVGGRQRAVSMLERIVSYNRQQLDEILSGKNDLTLGCGGAHSPIFCAEDRKWLDCLGFDTKEMIDFLGTDAVVVKDARIETGEEQQCRPAVNASKQPSEMQESPNVVAADMPGTSTESIKRSKDERWTDTELREFFDFFEEHGVAAARVQYSLARSRVYVLVKKCEKMFGIESKRIKKEAKKNDGKGTWPSAHFPFASNR
ncbi:hypothetical protein [Ralstonia holmesii]|uniref:hypothetical protein n=1 Tax=Ralstonia holmesii TaxID=3058602 RepID=UPI003F18A374